MNTQASSRIAINPDAGDKKDNNKGTYPIAIRTIETEKARAKKIREGLSGAGSCVPCFEWQQFEQWMRATCEGAELLRGNNGDDSDTDAGSDSDN